MDTTSDELPPIFVQVQKSLSPYIKTRQEVLRIRHVLAAHLNAQVDSQGPASRGGPLPLQTSSTNAHPTSRSNTGLRKEYIKSLKAHDRARQEYNELRGRHHVSHEKSEPHSAREIQKPLMESTTTPSPLEDHVLLAKRRQQCEKLRIMQNYLNNLAEKFATVAPNEEVISAYILPQVLPELVADVDSVSQESAEKRVGNLLLNLKKSILAAKAELQTEKRALLQVRDLQAKSRNAEINASSINKMQLHALDQTRNELIAWLERKLSSSGGEELEQVTPEMTPSPDTPTSVDDLLRSIKEQYLQYIEARRAFLSMVVGREDPAAITLEPKKERSATQDGVESVTAFVLPFIEDILNVTNEQKSLIQQRGHLTTNLAKQHKIMVHMFERLADESHLLPEFPLPPSQSAARDYGTFAEGLSSKESLSIADKARPWTYAADAAATHTKNAVLDNIESGSIAIEEARETLLAVSSMLGNDDDTKINSEKRGSHIWSLLDGQIGVLRRDAR